MPREKAEKPKGNPTIVDVAEEAGVSSMTVSRVLRGEGYASAATRAKVEAAARRLGYRSNPLVQALMSSVRRRGAERRANLAWVMQANSLNVPRDRLLAGARERALALSFGWEKVVLREADMSASRVAEILRARGVVGVVLAPLRQVGAALGFPWADFALATVGPSLREPRIHHTMMNHQHAAERVLAEVVARGYERVAFLSNADAEGRTERVSSMVFGEFNRGRSARHRIEPVNIDEWTDEALAAWFRRVRPDAVVASYPCRVARVRKLGLPEARETGWATLSWWPRFPEVTGVRHPLEALGAAAVDMVVAQIHRNERGVPVRPKTMLIEGDWVEGRTL